MTADNLPTPTAQLRDADSRLVGLIYDSRPPAAAGDSNWLIAIDGSRCSQQAVSEAIRLANDCRNYRLQMIYVQHWMSREGAENELARRGWTVSQAARQAIEAAGHAWRLHVVMGEYAESIIRVAEEQRSRGIIIGNRGLGATTNILIGSVAEKVIHLSPLPVLLAGQSNH